MRILHTIPGKNWGGMEQRVLDQMAWLLSHGHETWLATPQDGESSRRARDQGLPVIDFNFDAPWSLSTIWTLRKLVDFLRPDVADAHVTRDAKALFCAMDRLSLVRSRHVTHPLKGGLGRTLQWRIIPDHVIAVAGCVRDHLIDVGLAEPSRCSVIGEWADERFFKPPTPSLRPQLGISEDALVIGCVGMLRPDKGQDMLIEAFVTLLGKTPNATLLLIGAPTSESQDYARSLEEQVVTSGCRDRILLTGYREDIPELLDSCDIVAVPSRMEAQSRVVPQAFARQKPVVAFRVGGLPELVEDGVTGRLVAPGDAPGLADALHEMSRDTVASATLARNGHNFALAHLGFDSKMEETLAAYDKAIRRRKKP